MNGSLSWGLVISASRHRKTLFTCLSLAVEQSCKPKEIIIVDSYADEDEIKDRIKNEISICYPKIRWIYSKAESSSLTLQKNQGIHFATADIIFLINDSTFLYPTCAEKIMQVYAADTAKLVQGVQASSADFSMLLDLGQSIEAQPAAIRSTRKNWFVRVYDWVCKHIFLTDAKLLCIPYEKDFPQHEIPWSVRCLNVSPVNVFDGCCITYRRSIIITEQFEPLLSHSVIYEKLDASYRVSRHGALLEAGDAKVYQFQRSGDTIQSDYKATTLSSLSQALLLKKNSDDLERDRQRFYRLMTRRLLAEFLKDVFSGRWTLPHVRGLLTGLKYSQPIFALHPLHIAAWYPLLQEDLMQRF